MRRLAAWCVCLCLPFVVSACGPKGLKAKLIHAEQKAGQAETALTDAEKAMAELEPDAAQEQLDAAREALADPDAPYYPEHQMLIDRLKADEKKMPRVRELRARRDLEEAVARRQKETEGELADYNEALQAARGKGAGRAEAKDLRSALEEVDEALGDGKELEPKHAGYARFVADTRKSLETGKAELEALEDRVAFVVGPGEAWLEGKKLSDEAKAEQEPPKKRELYSEARTRLLACASQGKELLASRPRLERAVVVIGEGSFTPGQLVSRCTAQADAVAKALARAAKRAIKAAPAKASKKKR